MVTCEMHKPMQRLISKQFFATELILLLVIQSFSKPLGKVITYFSGYLTIMPWNTYLKVTFSKKMVTKRSFGVVFNSNQLLLKLGLKGKLIMENGYKY